MIDNETKAGYITLFCGWIVFFVLQYEVPGLFLQGAALGFFLTSIYKQLKNNRDNIRKE